MAFLAIRVEKPQRDILADEVLKLDRIVLRQQIEIKVEELRNPFLSGKSS